MTPADDAANPLLDQAGPTRYDAIRAEHMVPAMRSAAADAEAERERLLASAAPPTWDGFFAPLDDAEERVSRVWSAVSNLQATLGTDAIRAAHHEVQRAVTEHGTKLLQDDRVLRALRAIAEGPGAAALDPVRRKVLADHLRDRRLAGVDLPAAEKDRYRAIREELAKLLSEFADHVLDDVKEWRLVVDRREDLEGLPGRVVEAAHEQAAADAAAGGAAAGGERWAFTLDQPSIVPFLAFQRRRDLRERMSLAYGTRASSGPRDNAPLVRRMLALRREMAALLGFPHYAALSLATKMARSAEEVRAFLHDLARRARPRAAEEYRELCELARAEDGLDRVERWDHRFYEERLRARRHGFSQEDVRPYFPLRRVVDGLSRVLGRLYGVALRDVTDDGAFPTWHRDVRVLEATERGDVVGHVLFDACARPGKRQGAWVSGSVSRKRRRDGTLQRPVVHLVCNFPPPVGGAPSLLSHDEVRTFFHEFGHALHHLLTRVEHRDAAGTHGVPWDGVEFPSQFHENWIWHEESLALVSGHVETGEPLPPALLAKMLGARNFQSATSLLRQVEFALIDLELHAGFDPGRDDVRETVAAVRRIAGVVPEPPQERFENAFLHVFHGGYAAGYYGYKWSEVLAADAFGRFEEEGIFAEAPARAFRDTVLAMGGGEDFLGLFVKFRGRAPDAAALLRQSGIA